MVHKYKCELRARSNKENGEAMIKRERAGLEKEMGMRRAEKTDEGWRVVIGELVFCRTERWSIRTKTIGRVQAVCRRGGEQGRNSQACLTRRLCFGELFTCKGITFWWHHPVASSKRGHSKVQKRVGSFYFLFLISKSSNWIPDIKSVFEDICIILLSTIKCASRYPFMVSSPQSQNITHL